MDICPDLSVGKQTTSLDLTRFRSNVVPCFCSLVMLLECLLRFACFSNRLFNPDRANEIFASISSGAMGGSCTLLLNGRSVGRTLLKSKLLSDRWNAARSSISATCWFALLRIISDCFSTLVDGCWRRWLLLLSEDAWKRRWLPSLVVSVDGNRRRQLLELLSLVFSLLALTSISTFQCSLWKLFQLPTSVSLHSVYFGLHIWATVLLNNSNIFPVAATILQFWSGNGILRPSRTLTIKTNSQRQPPWGCR